jgi:uncharacterized membrane protein
VDGDPVVWSLLNPPEGMTIGANTGIISWTPVDSQVGDNSISIIASDGLLSDTVQLVLTVMQINDPPVITSTPPTAAMQDLQYSYQVQVDDPDIGDSVAYQLATFPAGMTISAGGLILWTPTSAQVGNHDVKFYVRDDSLAVDSQSYQITVSNVNDPPVITTSALNPGTEDVPYLDTILANDPDGNPVVWSLLNPPEGMTIGTNTGIISWTPVDSQAGDNSISIIASDGVLADTVQLVLTVMQINEAPVITVNIPDVFEIGTLYQIPLTATDEENDGLIWSVPKKPVGMSVISDALVWTPNASDAGMDTLVIVVSDGTLSDTLEKVITVSSTTEARKRALKTPKVISFAINPNPVTSNTEIRIGIPETVREQPRLALYDLKGRLINNWNLKEKGYYSIAWNGLDRKGMRMNSGMYVVRLTCADKVIQKKMLLLK